MNIHRLITTGLILASDEGADMLIILDHDSGELVAYTGNSGDYEPTDSTDIDGEPEDIDEWIATAEEYLNDLIDVPGDSVIDGEAEEV
jgi:hypothetical protein